MPLPYWAEKWEWYQLEPYCSARNLYTLVPPLGGIGHSVTPLAPSWKLVPLWRMPCQWIEVL